MEEQIAYYKQKLQFETDSRDLAEALKVNKDIIVIDSRTEEAYQLEHIPGAINFPLLEISAQTTVQLDHTKVYVIYDDGTGSNISLKAAFNLSRFGFRIKELLGGLDCWKQAGYQTHGTLAHNSEVISCIC